MGIKRDALDALFSDLVRNRANWTCEKCEINYEHEPSNMHCAHIIGRRILRLRHHPANALCLCASCHHYFTDRPMEWTAFVRKVSGDTAIDELIRLSNDHTFKAYKDWKKDARKHYREEAAKMKAERMRGVPGHIEFIGFW